MGKDEYADVCNPTANWSCMKCLFPMTFDMDSQETIPPIPTTSGLTNNLPQVRLIRGFKVAHLNVNRIVNKLDGVRELLSSYAFDVLALSETWLSSSITDNEIDIAGYTIA